MAAGGSEPLRLVLDVHRYSYDKAEAEALGLGKGDLQGCKLAGFMLAYYPLAAGSAAPPLPAGADVEVVHTKKQHSYLASKSNDCKLYAGCSFSALHLTTAAPALYGIKLQLYALSRIDVVDVGSAKWRPTDSQTLLQRGYKMDVSMPITREGRRVGHLHGRVSITVPYEPTTTTTGPALAHPAPMSLARFQFRARTRRVNWTQLARLDLDALIAVLVSIDAGQQAAVHVGGVE